MSALTGIYEKLNTVDPFGKFTAPMSPLSTVPTIPVVPTRPTSTIASTSNHQLEALVFAEFKQLLLCRRFRYGNPQSRQKRLVAAFESPYNVHNIRSFCSRNQVPQGVVSQTLKKLVDKITSKGSKKRGTLITPFRLPGALGLADYGKFSDYQIRTVDCIDSDEEMLDASPVKSHVTLLKPAQDYRPIFGVPSPQITTPTTPLMAPTMMQSLSLNTPPQSGCGVPKEQKQLHEVASPAKENYIEVPTYTPLPVLIGGTALGTANAPLFGPESLAGRKSIKALFKERNISLSLKTKKEKGENRRQNRRGFKKKNQKGKKQKISEDLTSPMSQDMDASVDIAIGSSEIQFISPKSDHTETKNPTTAPGSTKDKPINIPASPPSSPPRPVLTVAVAQKATPSPPVTRVVAFTNPRPSQPDSRRLYDTLIMSDHKMSYAIDAIIWKNLPPTDVIYLPYPVQFTILTETQYVLECVCHKFAKKWLPHLTSTPGFLYPECAELSVWVRTMIQRENLSRIPDLALDLDFMRQVDRTANPEMFLRRSVRDLIALRNQTVHRHNMNCLALGTLLDISVRVAKFMKNPVEATYLQKIWDKKKELVTALRKGVRDIRFDMSRELVALYLRDHTSKGWYDLAVKAGLERRRQVEEGIRLSLDDLKALKHEPPPKPNNEVSSEDVPMEISDGPEP
ncbi:hypothetical protein TWF281_009048 [Arthrobotrys megalospora]